MTDVEHSFVFSCICPIGLFSIILRFRLPVCLSLLFVISCRDIEMPKGLYFTVVVFFSFFLFISTINLCDHWRISTKLGHIFTYDCYLINLVRTPPGICLPHGLREQKPLFWDRLWTLTEHISATENDINSRKETGQSTRTPYMPLNLANFDPETVENGWQVLAQTLNFRNGRPYQPYRMDVIITGIRQTLARLM